MRIAFTLAGSLLVHALLAQGTAIAACDPAASPRPSIIGYYTSWSIYARGFHVDDIDASKLTHVHYAFANVHGPTGSAVLGDPWADVEQPRAGDCTDPGCLRGNFRRLALLKERFPHLKVMISIGGWTWSEHFSDIALTPASRQRFAQSVVDLFILGRFGPPFGDHPGVFDGVDIDWEYPGGGGLHPGRPEDRQNFTLLLQELRQQLDTASLATGRAYELSIAAGASPERLANLDLRAIATVVDHVGLMSYDFHGSWDAVTNFNAPLHASSADPSSFPAASCVEGAVRNALDGGLPADRLVLGVPFYGRSWSGAGSGNGGLYQPATGAGPGTWEPGNLDYWDIVANRIPASARFVHQEARVPWLLDGTTFISYDDPDSVRAKVDLAVELGLGGVIIWELSGDLRGSPAPAASLLATIAEALCPPPPGRILDLRMARRGDALLLTWTPDAGALGGHHLYRTALREESGSQRDERPGHDPFLSAPTAPPFPVVVPNGVTEGLAYYQVLAVGADGSTEGPN